MTTILNLPKDMLVKLIIMIEETTSKFVGDIYKKHFERWDEIFRQASDITPVRLSPRFHRCEKPGCLEYQVENDKFGTGDDSPENLISCEYCATYGSREYTRKYFCKIHENFTYFFNTEMECEEPLCEKCIQNLSEEYIPCEQVQKRNSIKAKLTRENKESKENELNNKISRYYKLSKPQLLEKLCLSEGETLQRLLQVAVKEQKVRVEMLECANSLIFYDHFKVKVQYCEYENCNKVKVYNSKNVRNFKECKTCHKKHCSKHTHQSKI